MRNDREFRTDSRVLLSRAAHVVARAGLAMAGAMSGTFVAAELAKADFVLFDTVGFVVAMVLIGITGFYLGIDIPRQPRAIAGARTRIDAVEWLSAAGTFLAAAAAMVSVYSIVFDEVPPINWEVVFGCWWLLGTFMQTGAGLIGRLQPAAA